MTTNRLFLLTSMAAVALQGASAFALKQATPCDRSLTPASMTEAEKAELSKNGIVERPVPGRNGFFVNYLFGAANFDPELAMGVYTTCSEHAGDPTKEGHGLGDFIKVSQMKSPEDANPFQVYYEQSGSWGFSGGEYQVENIVGRDGQSYLMNSRLVNSSDSHFSPSIADAYMRVIPMGPNQLFVIACNYMEPKNLPFPQGISRNTYNGMAKDRLMQSGQNLMRWVQNASQDSGRAEEYREHLKTLLSHQPSKK